MICVKPLCGLTWGTCFLNLVDYIDQLHAFYKGSMKSEIYPKKGQYLKSVTKFIYISRLINLKRTKCQVPITLSLSTASTISLAKCSLSCDRILELKVVMANFHQVRFKFFCNKAT